VPHGGGYFAPGKGEILPPLQNFFVAVLIYWSFDYFPYNAAKRSRRERFAAGFILAAPI
jgi:hypothetical protein